jgi:hypothetical protein
MDTLITARIVIAAVGIVVWAVGYARESDDIRLIGIVIMAVSLILRFAARRTRNQEPRADQHTPDQ